MRRVLLATLLLACACGEPAPPCARGDLTPPPTEPRFAVVASDYASTAVALLDPRGEAITASFVDSGTTRPGLSSTLGGDVVLPSAAEPGVLTVIDRLGVDVVTRIALGDGAVLGQLRTSDTFRGNPHDAIALEGALYVTRHEPNLDPPSPAEAGSDLVVFDLATGERARRIDLSSLDVVRDGITHHARPSRIVVLRAGAATRLLVGLVRIRFDADFAPIPGAVAIVDPVTGAVAELALDGLSNCGEAAPVPGDPARAHVLCIGRGFDPATGRWFDDELRRAESGLAAVALQPDGTAVAGALHRARDHTEVHPPSLGLVPLDAGRAVLVGAGANGEPDELLQVDLSGGTVRVLDRSTASFDLGTGAFDPGTGLLLVPDRSRGILRIDLEAGTATPTAFDPCHGLPPVEIRLLRSPV